MSDQGLPPAPTTAVLLIAHGSRRASANDDLIELAQRLRAVSDYKFVEIAFLELAEPTIPHGIASCVSRGAHRVLMLPYFLSAGAHVSEDLERFRAQAAAEHPGITFVLCEPLGRHALIVDVVLDRLRAADTPR